MNEALLGYVFFLSQCSQSSEMLLRGHSGGPRIDRKQT